MTERSVSSSADSPTPIDRLGALEARVDFLQYVLELLLLDKKGDNQ